MTVKAFGDHDLKGGFMTIDKLKKEKFDLLILLGDYSYDMENDNGNHGDDYFQRMGEIMTR